MSMGQQHVWSGDPYVSCGTPMVTQRVYAANRERCKAEGVREHIAHGQCKHCYVRPGKDTTPQSRACGRSLADFAAAYKALPAGLTGQQCADRLGYSYKTYLATIGRARRAGLLPRPDGPQKRGLRKGEARNPIPRPLAAGELARLRASVGLPTVLPGEVAS